jgi:hypothetical protein
MRMMQRRNALVMIKFKSWRESSTAGNGGNKLWEMLSGGVN